ncbi:hypothetical protein SAMN04489761_2588 [Tenacibaculum sp. MAR_2009_124]|uniref:hypothetical protein n=1 Tax=Tenacibaculum sp. MAR_2009_124 TaxID=1250059 RepID=UPI000894EAF7|nr:hypothetical protein [Tenacibaculum sp. MAR_2009_124]SEC28962.1 hypothetical protein SAMN04489761_2588 [Tenacibaculum sp. MAR_2009_124]
MGLKRVTDKLRRLFQRKSKSLLTVEQQRYVNEETIKEAEKELEKLKNEEDKARAKVIEGLNDIFNDLPHLL